MAEVYSNYASTSTCAATSKPEDACKIFVGGLSWETTQEKLNAYFSQFGDVVDCILMMDTTTKRSRGFGFVTYKDPTSVIKVLDSGPHILDNKSIDPKAAVPRYPCPASNAKPSLTTVPNSPSIARRCNKIFVGGIGPACEDDLRSYFQSFGTVTDVTIMMDKNTGRPRGFAFVGFESVESSEQTAQIRYHTIKGKRVEVKVAQPRDSKGADCSGSDDGIKNDSESYNGNDDICMNGNALIRNFRFSDNPVTQYTKNSIVRTWPNSPKALLYSSPI